MAGLQSTSQLLSPIPPRNLRLFPIAPEAYFEILVTRLPFLVPATGWPPCLPSRASPSLACFLDPPPFPLPFLSFQGVAICASTGTSGACSFLGRCMLLDVRGRRSALPEGNSGCRQWQCCRSEANI